MTHKIIYMYTGDYSNKISMLA